jgi:hypothetical protein
VKHLEKTPPHVILLAGLVADLLPTQRKETHSKRTVTPKEYGRRLNEYISGVAIPAQKQAVVVSATA